MIPLGPSHRFYLYREPADMRKSFYGLCGLVRSGLNRDPLSGEVFVFINRRRTHTKRSYQRRCRAVGDNLLPTAETARGKPRALAALRQASSKRPDQAPLDSACQAVPRTSSTGAVSGLSEH